MAVITHAFVSGKTAAADATVVDGVDWDAGHVVTGLPGEELDYVQITTSVPTTQTTEAAATTVVTSSSLSYDGSTTIMVEFFADSLAVAASTNAFSRLYLYDGSTSLGRIARCRTVSAISMTWPVHVFKRLTPSAGSHAYSVRIDTSASTSTLEAGPGGSGNSAPAFIRITRV